MRKNEFLDELRNKLSGVPENVIEERLDFYSEMIEDKIEDGISEEDAVSEICDIDKIVTDILSEISLLAIVKDRIKPKRRLNIVNIILIVLGSPIWISLFVTVFAVALSLYISLWAIIISLWAVFASLIACSVGCVLACIVLAIYSSSISWCFMLAIGLVCAGLSIFMYFGCKYSTIGIVVLTKKAIMMIKRGFVRKEKS